MPSKDSCSSFEGLPSKETWGLTLPSSSRCAMHTTKPREHPLSRSCKKYSRHDPPSDSVESMIFKAAFPSRSEPSPPVLFSFVLVRNMCDVPSRTDWKGMVSVSFGAFPFPSDQAFFLNRGMKPDFQVV
eukprot:scaffold840_cov344-Pavlova_lutheri.AAC.34